jgi:hypothetical protein
MRWLLGALVASLCSVACVDTGDTGDAAAQGTLGGPCFPNNTCNGSLVCSLVNGKAICQEGDASVQDVVTNDSTKSDAPNDVGTDVADAGCTVQPTLACGNLQCHTQGKGCCEKTQTCGASATDCNGTPLFECSSGNDCTGNMPCCITAAFDTSSCPFNTQQTGLQVQCSTVGTCQSGWNVLCTTNNECSGSTPTCKPFMLDGHVFGVCM